MIGTVLSTVPTLSLLALVHGISRPTFYDIMRKHGVSCDERTVFSNNHHKETAEWKSIVLDAGAGTR
jgi:hypothetical protein